jgi:hypothetical protein
VQLAKTSSWQHFRRRCGCAASDDQSFEEPGRVDVPTGAIPTAALVRRCRRSENRFKEGSAHFQCLVERERVAGMLWALGVQPLPELCVGAEECNGPAARCRCPPAIGEIVPDDGIDGSRMAQRLPTLDDADFDPASASSAGRLDHCICTKHSSDAESIDCTDCVKPLAAKLYAVFRLFPGEWVSIKDDVC